MERSAEGRHRASHRARGHAHLSDLRPHTQIDVTLGHQNSRPVAKGLSREVMAVGRRAGHAAVHGAPPYQPAVDHHGGNLDVRVTGDDACRGHRSDQRGELHAVIARDATALV